MACLAGVGRLAAAQEEPLGEPLGEREVEEGEACQGHRQELVAEAAAGEEHQMVQLARPQAQHWTMSLEQE